MITDVFNTKDLIDAVESAFDQVEKDKIEIKTDNPDFGYMSSQVPDIKTEDNISTAELINGMKDQPK